LGAAADGFGATDDGFGAAGGGGAVFAGGRGEASGDFCTPDGGTFTASFRPQPGHSTGTPGCGFNTSTLVWHFGHANRITADPPETNA
jgi:hypothetical protein